MTKKKPEQIYLPEIGEARIKYNPRSKRVYLRMKPFEGLTISLPTGLSPDTIPGILMGKKSWILKTREKMRQIEGQQTLFLPGTSFQTREHSLRILKGKYARLASRIQNREIKIMLPLDCDPAAETTQGFIRKAIERALKLEGQKYLPQRLDELAKIHKFKYKEVLVNYSKTKWGSCSSQDVIRLNYHLMRLPDSLCDYVLLHELAHIKVKNHSATFWKLLRTLDSRALDWDRELKNYHISIY